VLTTLALGTMLTRWWALGHEVRYPVSAHTWKVTLAVHGSLHGEGRLTTALPLDLGRQHVLRERHEGSSLESHHAAEKSGERALIWSPSAGKGTGRFRLRCESLLNVEVLHPTSSMTRAAHGLYAAPGAEQFLEVEKNVRNRERLRQHAVYLTRGLEDPAEVAGALFRFVVSEVRNEPTLGTGEDAEAIECLDAGAGTSLAKSRLLVALLRARGIPARIAQGVTLTKGPEQRPHAWVEAWLGDHWSSLCPFYGHSGKVPSTFALFAIGDRPLVRGQHVKDLDYAFLLERAGSDELHATDSAVQSFFRHISLHMLPPAEQQLVEFLLLLPVAALIICVFRNLIGLNSFGTFAPALVGLAFRNPASRPGLLVFAGILIVGWLMRRLLDRYHLLQVPRVALMLTLLVSTLIVLVVVANSFDLPPTRYISLFPLIILTGMVERFWTLEAEDGLVSSFRTLLSTLFISAVIALVLSLSIVVRTLFCFPELLGIVMAAQLFVGRYTGYRLMELLRFRDFLRPTEPTPA
jgi:hypothetical protein